jgi:Ankyrin repeats (3 copies)
MINLDIKLQEIEKQANYDFLYIRSYLDKNNLTVLKPKFSIKKHKDMFQAIINIDLLRSSKNNDLNAVGYLIKEWNADVNTYGGGPLLYSIYNGNLQMIKLLVKKGADFTVRRSCALRYAAEDGYLDIVKYAKEKHYIKIDLYNQYALRYSAQNNHLPVFKFLLRHGADINYAISWCAKKNHVYVIRCLIGQYNSIRIVDINYALQWCARTGNLNAVKCLVENGAKVNANGCKALEYAIENNHLTIVEYLDDNGANIHYKRGYALRLSAKHGYLNLVEYFVGRAIDIALYNYLAIKLSQKNGHMNVYTYLLNIVINT